MPKPKLPTAEDGLQALLDFFAGYDPADALKFILYLRNLNARNTVGKARGLLALAMVRNEMAKDDTLTFEHARYRAAERNGWTGTSRPNFFRLVDDGLDAERSPEDTPLPVRRNPRVSRPANT